MIYFISLLACHVTIIWHQRTKNMKMCCWIIEIFIILQLNISHLRGLADKKSVWIPDQCHERKKSVFILKDKTQSFHLFYLWKEKRASANKTFNLWTWNKWTLKQLISAWMCIRNIEDIKTYFMVIICDVNEERTTDYNWRLSLHSRFVFRVK